MLFKFCQIIVAFLISVSSLFTVTIPTPVVETENPLVSVNPNPIAEEKLTQDVKVMSFNLKYNGDGYQTRENRFPKAVKIIEKHSPDSFGVQEAEKWWTDSFEETLTQYARVGTFRDDGISLGESSSVFYLKDKYELVDSGDFWLSETPDVASRGWDGACNRITTWAILKDKTTGFVYAHFNTHLDHVGDKAQAESVPLIASKIAEIAPDIPVVLTGDFNLTEDSGNYVNIISCDLRDTRFLAKKHDDCATYHDFNPFVFNTKPIDFIFVNGYCKSVKSSIVDSSTVGLVYPSDHFPVIVEMTLFNGGNK